ncbi:two-component system chemotaxis sensor kinase CheA [Paenibacillus phyllosphaerae]|uniref:Circadian input-output histidine kinase CikA n=1 Tax=Paenibacillus phyllosphaerae TaxID=274593 RepID=A0A7W5B0G2_9BACL|nr:ATP-binding protein [Paenibacillus phyllosphaerae]MBB3112185.1 two-component system chemotaxis sensor kinase CheA [Paenibacillus phyllosphaerae]
MTLAKNFFASISILITLAYLFNIGHKYLLVHTSARVKYALSVAVFIASGWLAMVFGVRIGEVTMLDLRYVPVILAILVFGNPWTIIAIGAGIGLGRFYFSWDLTAVLGFATMIVLGITGAILHIMLKRSTWRFCWKAATAIILINVLNTLLAFGTVSINGSMTVAVYWRDVGQYALPGRTLMCLLFVFIIRDFEKEQRRVEELRTMNTLLRRQTEQLREAKQDMEQQAAELQRVSAYKSEFLANMSHELKTPLNSIILLSQLIRDNEDRRYEEEDQAYAALIQTAGDELLQLINDILDLSKVEAGKMDVVFEQVSVQSLVHLLHQQFSPMAQQKKLEFNVHMLSDVPESIITDELRVNQILRNLLVNAFKFTSAGSVVLEVRLEGSGLYGQTPKRGKGKGWLRERRAASKHADWPMQQIAFTVIDTGIGIDEAKQQLIFEAFRQEDGGINRKYGGTGLGLSISQQLAALLGGRLSLRSRKDAGSSFTLHLPLCPPATNTAAEECASASSESS